jgi:glycosyltransferase involved in cell wall biosynthesis
MKLGIFIPAHNEEATVGLVLASIPKHIPPFDYIKVFVIDDGSTDNTAKKAVLGGAEVVGIHPNRGLAQAYKIGLQTCLDAGVDILCHLDADNQYTGQEIALIVAPIVEGHADFVTGDRQVAKLDFLGFARKYGNMAGSWSLRALTGMKVRDASSGFRAYSREVAAKIEVHSNHTYTHETLIEAFYKGFRVAEVPITFSKRGAHVPLEMQKWFQGTSDLAKPEVLIEDSNVSRLTRNLFKHIYCSFRDILRAKARYSGLKKDRL